QRLGGRRQQVAPPIAHHEGVALEDADGLAAHEIVSSVREGSPARKTRSSAGSRWAADRSPLTRMRPCSAAVITFCLPSKIRAMSSSFAEMVQSAGDLLGPSSSRTEPS